MRIIILLINKYELIAYLSLTCPLCTTDSPPLLQHESIIFVVGDIDYKPITTT